MATNHKQDSRYLNFVERVRKAARSNNPETRRDALEAARVFGIQLTKADSLDGARLQAMRPVERPNGAVFEGNALTFPVVKR
jgi:hypothetical protein